jgi:hypothetical protein
MGERRPRAKGERVTVVDWQNEKSFFVEKDDLVNRIASHMNVTQISTFHTEQDYKGPTEEKSSRYPESELHSFLSYYSNR